MSATNKLLIHNAPVQLGEGIKLWGGDDAFTHLLVFGPTRCGKTSTILNPMCYEMMMAKKRGKKVGFTVIEPKGDLVQDIYDMAIGLGLEDEVIFLDPTNPNSHRLNVMQGEEAAVIEATVAVLQSLFGKQEKFFEAVQETSARNVIALLKRLYNDNLDLTTVLENLRDLNIMTSSLAAYKKQIGGTDDLSNFFDNELLGSGKMSEKYQQLVIGLRAQLENIVSNPNLRNVITGQSDIQLDKHLEDGKILLVNTAAGSLGKAGDAFGMFVSMHIQLATFRRKGNEFSRIPHYLIIDEYSQYINPYVARFLSFAASYRVALVAALQSFNQLEVASGDQDAKSIRNAIINTARNKIIFGGVENEDAKFAADMMGAEEIVSRTNMYEGGIIPSFLPKSYRHETKERQKFTQRFFMDGMPRFHCVCKLVENGVATPSFLAKGEWIPRNWREKAQEEDAVLLMSDDERLEQLEKNRPPLWQWKERALFDVEIQKIKGRQKKRALIGENPFANDETAPLVQNPIQHTEPLQQIPVANNLYDFSSHTNSKAQETQAEPMRSVPPQQTVQPTHTASQTMFSLKKPVVSEQIPVVEPVPVYAEVAPQPQIMPMQQVQEQTINNQRTFETNIPKEQPQQSKKQDILERKDEDNFFHF